jgi:hypothetical protein
MERVATRRLIDASATLDAADRALLNLWVNRGLDDAAVARMTGMEPAAIAERRGRIADRLSAELGLPPADVAGALGAIALTRMEAPDDAATTDAAPNDAALNDAPPDDRAPDDGPSPAAPAQPASANGGRPAAVAPASLNGHPPAAAEAEALPGPEPEPEAPQEPAPEPEAHQEPEPHQEPDAHQEPAPEPEAHQEPEPHQEPEAYEEPAASTQATALEPEPEPQRRRRWPVVAAALLALAAVVVVIVIASGGSSPKHRAQASTPPPTTATQPAAAQSTTAPASSTPTTTPNPTPPGNSLGALPGGLAHAHGSVVLAGRPHHLKLKLTVRGLSAAHHGHYEVWLYNTLVDSQPLARLRNGVHHLLIRLPRHAGRFGFIDISYQPAGVVYASGESVLRAANPARGAGKQLRKHSVRRRKLHPTK